MLKRIDEKQSIVIEEVENTKVKSWVDIQIEKGYGKMVEEDRKEMPNIYKKMLEVNYVFFYTKTKRVVVCEIVFKTIEEAQDYANKIMNTNLDYNDYKKHKEKEGE